MEQVVEQATGKFPRQSAAGLERRQQMADCLRTLELAWAEPGVLALRRYLELRLQETDHKLRQCQPNELAGLQAIAKEFDVLYQKIKK